MKNEILRNGYLEMIKECTSADISIERVCIIMRAWELPHRVRTATPNVIEYWKDELDIRGSITK
jgi:hypothetical protein